MSELDPVTKEKRPRWQRLLRFLLIKLPLLIFIIGLVMVLALKMVERYPNPLREGFEEYLSESSGTNVSLGKMEEFAFIPDLHLKASGVTYHARGNAANVLLSVEEAELSAPFVSVFFSLNQLNTVSVSNLEAKEGFLLPKALTIETMDIVQKDGPEQYGSFLTARGTYSGQDMFLEAELQNEDEHYTVPQLVPFSLTIGDATLGAGFYKGRNTLELKNAVYRTGDFESEAGDYVLVKSGEYIKKNPLQCMLEQPGSEECQTQYKDGTNQE
jgi:hypothetical protein